MATTISPIHCPRHRLLLFTCFNLKQIGVIYPMHESNLNGSGSIDQATLTHEVIFSLNIDPGTTSKSLALHDDRQSFGTQVIW